MGTPARESNPAEATLRLVNEFRRLPLTAWLAVWLLVTVFTVALIAVGAGPGRTRRPALTALVLVTGVVLLTALPWPP
ncbi:hypothetical protein [Streptomyces sp. RB17]|uniref:hypothetical protein n=1 Tax=Streptomyces sp. RB17 TaxID=2585197 RepID=UPI001296B079|nr:hypothetical protein [Streptomyces sp. RB17]